MRRPAPEWLLAPVFLLPLAAAAALVLWARHDYFARIEPYRADGEAMAPRSASASAELFDLADRFSKRLYRPAMDAEDWAPFRLSGLSGFVRVSGVKGLKTDWILSDQYPAGLSSASLADSGARLAIETGVAPARHPGADAGTTAFRRFIESPDLAELRDAPLPASTKLYLLHRAFPDASPTDVRALTILATLERSFGDRLPGLSTGAHVADGLVVLVRSGPGPVLVLPDAEMSAMPWMLNEADFPEVGNRNVHLLYSPTAVARADVVWHGRLDAPLAGEWAFVAPSGDRWWESEAFMRWALPAAIACVAFLFVPTALLVAIRRRRKLDDSRARFVNELAHDLRTPVTSLRLHAEMLSEGRVPAGEEKRYLDVLGRETARLSALLANLLDLSRVERGAREYELRPVDVAEVVDETTRDFALLHPKRAADVSVEATDGLAANADRTALVRCLANLLDNAGKFTKPGTAIRVTTQRTDGARVRIVVADDGPGIAPTDRARVFRLYERGAPASTNGAPGTGLGLALVRELAHGMGGGVTLLATPRGAAFEILLPEAPHG